MGELRFYVQTRRQGKPIHGSDKFETEEYETITDLLDAIEHYVLIQYEEEAEYSYRNEGNDDDQEQD